MNYLLSCESCDTTLEVSPAKAGGQVECPSCNGSVPVPKLGVLRGLPVAQSGADQPPARSSGGGQFVFAAMAAIALLCFIAAGYCGIRWAMIEVPMTTEQNIADVEQKYAELPAANLVREWEDMEKYGMDLVGSFGYHVLQKQKDGWRNGAVATSGIGVLALVIGIATTTFSRKK